MENLMEFEGTLEATGEFTVKMVKKPHLYIKTQTPLTEEDDNDWGYMMEHSKELFMEGLDAVLPAIETNEVD